MMFRDGNRWKGEGDENRQYLALHAAVIRLCHDGRRYSAQFNAYVGKPFSQAILRYGPPATTMELDGKKYYGWRIDWQGEPCQWTFSVQDKTITAVQWNGSPNACWSMSYYKH